MAIYRQVYMTFWTDPKVVNDFTPEDRYFYLYLITNDHTNICGCYEISIKQMVWETGYNEDTVGRLIRRLTETHKVIRYDAVTNEMLIHKWHKYNWTRSKDLLSKVRSVAQEIKNPSFKAFVLEKIDGGGTVVPRCGDGGGTSVPVPVSVADAVPDPEEVRAYVKEMKYKIDPDRFYSFYKQKGFPDDWKAQVDYWEQTEYKKSPKKHTGYIQRSSPQAGDFGTEYLES